MYNEKVKLNKLNLEKGFFMQENILITDAKLINGLYGESDKFLKEATLEDFLFAVQNAHTFMPRDEVENDPTKKQIIAYCVIRKGDEIFVTKRLKKQSEKRLHDRHSIGVGGHINTTDLTSENVVLVGMERELHEEVFISDDFSAKFLGVINDNSTQVNSVHCGACFMITLESGDCSVKETEKMEGFWVHKDNLREYFDKMEGWSQIVINSIF